MYYLIFEDLILTEYKHNDVLENAELYQNISIKCGIVNDSNLKNRIRWCQQSLKNQGIIKNVERGKWMIA